MQRKEYLTDLIDKFNKLIDQINTNEIMSLWQTGLGDMNKYLKGENPLPDKSKKATIDSWKGCRKLTKYKKIECNIILTPEEFKILSMGHIPEVMEDHWFMYCDENTINYFRSWSGIQIYKGYYKLQNDSYIIYSLEINSNKKEYKEENINKSFEIFNNLITLECKTYK